ncbi:glycoside hydrolase family 19 protein [Niveibacterium umoris]|uniref:Putative chitinase n=2 Tax=Niveibacterium umoris TaxID=1193620 RepID=A0A840BFW7_9RHOO|nr:glycoside hydrolase family 19 protein [Niveibacterium umoris]MBB4011084.1 putative chitinase [Niveibacterium umoris]
MLTARQIANIYACKADRAEMWLPHLQAAARLCDVDEDHNRLACFLAQVGHESGRLRYTREIWGPTAQQKRYEYGTPLAKSLGNFRPGDGKRYMGRGLIQVTGRVNYHITTQRMREALKEGVSNANDLPDVPDFEDDPEALERPMWAALSAGLYWKLHKLNLYADKHDFVTLTRRINGGINGLADRQALFATAFSSLLD